MHPEPNPHGDEPGFGQTQTPLFNVVYCSRASADVDKAAVDRIIASSHRNNPRWGITGLLVFGEGYFFQWLEGPRASIENLLALLRSDQRHGQIVMLSQAEESHERMFPTWDMELVEAEQIRDVLADALSESHDPHEVQALQAMLDDIDARWGQAKAA